MKERHDSHEDCVNSAWRGVADSDTLAVSIQDREHQHAVSEASPPRAAATAFVRQGQTGCYWIPAQRMMRRSRSDESECSHRCEAIPTRVDHAHGCRGFAIRGGNGSRLRHAIWCVPTPSDCADVPKCSRCHAISPLWWSPFAIESRGGVVIDSSGIPRSRTFLSSPCEKQY